MVVKRFLMVLVSALCSFFLFAGVVTAKNNTQRSLRAVESEIIDETQIINAFKEKLSKFNLYFK